MTLRSLASTRARSAVPAAALVAGLMVIAGCSGGSGDDPSPTSATVTAATPTQTPTTETPEPTETYALPPLPEAAKENTPEGAEAFIRYYFDVVNALYVKPTPGVVTALGHPECLSCEGSDRTLAGLAEVGSRLKVKPLNIESMQRVGGSSDGIERFNMVVNAPANATVESDGSETDPVTPFTMSGVGAAYWEEDQWLLYDLGLTRS